MGAQHRLVGELLAGSDPPVWDARTGLWLPASQRKPTLIDLFCGAGGMSLGFIEAGWRVVAGLDNDPAAAVTYLMNLGTWPMTLLFATDADRDRLNRFIEREWRRAERAARQAARWPDYVVAGRYRPPDREPVRGFVFGDIRQVRGADVLAALGYAPGEIDCVAGGPPCQGFSRVGRRNVLDPRNSLVFEFARLVLEIRPRAVLMENVPDLVSMVTPEGVPVLDAFARILADGDFAPYEAVRRSLAGQPGRRAVLRADGETRPAQRARPPRRHDATQLDWVADDAGTGGDRA
jgi:DNA (cytosine-5)-methyltransferase 1